MFLALARTLVFDKRSVVVDTLSGLSAILAIGLAALAAMVLSFVAVVFGNWMSGHLSPTKKAEEPDDGSIDLLDPRDLMESNLGEPDSVVIDHINWAVEQLQEHMELPTLGAYERFLKRELEWITHEKDIRRALARY